MLWDIFGLGIWGLMLLGCFKYASFMLHLCFGEGVVEEVGRVLVGVGDNQAKTVYLRYVCSAIQYMR